MKTFTLSLSLFFCCLSFGLHAATFTFISSFGNWNDPNSWDTGTVPNANDEVVIPAGRFAILPNGYTSQIENAIVNGYLFNFGTLYITNNFTTGLSIAGGYVSNRSTLIIEKAGQFGINAFNTGQYRNEGGSHTIIGKTGDDGMSFAPAAQLLNYGFIEILGGVIGDGIHCEGTFRNNPLGVIEISNCLEKGLWVQNGPFNNYGSISILGGVKDEGVQIEDCAIAFNRAGASIEVLEAGLTCFILKDSEFINEATASISLQACGQEASPIGLDIDGGIFDDGIFDNYGLLEIFDIQGSSSSTRGIMVDGFNGFFNNKANGIINIASITGTGISTRFEAIFENELDGIIIIQDVGQNGIDNHNAFINRGMIYSLSSEREGITSFFSSAIFDNFGLISIQNIGTALRALDVGGSSTFHNHTCGVVELDEGIDIFGTIINEGFLHTEGEHSAFSGPGTLNNSGVIEDEDGDLATLSGIVTNNGIIVSPKQGPLVAGVPVPNFLDLGSLADHEVLAVYRGPGAATTIAGTYNAITNTFTPNANGAGATLLYVEVENLIENCDDLFGMEIDNTPFADPQEKRIDTDNVVVDLQVAPNPTSGRFIISGIEAESAEWQIINTLGQSIWQGYVKRSGKFGNSIPKKCYCWDVLASRAITQWPIHPISHHPTILTP